MISMKIPNLKDAKVRTRNKSITKENEYILNDNLRVLGKGKTYFVKTYGCQMNEHDSENIKAILEDMSFTEVDDMEKADLIILNTCAIRENAHNKVFGMLGRIKHLKESRPDIITGVCGCMVQEESVVEEIMTKYKWIDIVFGTHNIHNLPNILNTSLAKNKLEVEVLSIEGDVLENIPVKRENPYKAWVNIMYGCDKFCTYCIVPYTRGKQRSRKIEDILKECKELVDQGYQEITLIGQNVNAYAKDLNFGYDFATLLEEVAKLNIPRLRFTTSHPWDFTEGMFKVIGQYKNIMPALHLPLQSGSNDVLRRMGRRYTAEEYMALVDRLRELVPGVAITTDIIVGFPNETDEDFEKTLEVVKYVKYDSAFTFIYSPRVGTPGAKMKDSISMEVKHQRFNRLVDTLAVDIKAKADAYINKVVPVLVDGCSKKTDSMLSGYTDTLKLVNFKGNPDHIGKIVNVKILEAHTYSLIGEEVDG